MSAAGLLNQRVTFQTKTETISASGNVTAAWTDSFTAWGRMKFEDGTAAESEIADKPTVQTRVTLIVRYRADIATGMRVKWGARYFEVMGMINRDERNRMLDLPLIERASP